MDHDLSSQACAPDETTSDPIISCIALHLRAHGGLNRAVAADKNETIVRAWCFAEVRAREKLYRVAPTTVSGARHLIAHILETADFEDIYDTEWRSLLTNLGSALRLIA
jgi:hypothetical protein